MDISDLEESTLYGDGRTFEVDRFDETWCVLEDEDGNKWAMMNATVISKLDSGAWRRE